jgi:hypothetical protein
MAKNRSSHTSSKIRAFGITQLPDILSKAFPFSSCIQMWIVDACLDMLVTMHGTQACMGWGCDGWKWRVSHQRLSIDLGSTYTRCALDSEMMRGRGGAY